jgi:L-histidine N-alpha-methyltransferase
LSIHATSRSVPKRLSIVRVPEERNPETFAQAVRAGLTSSPKTLPCRFFYDGEGSQLFERICDLPEYYLTRTEDAILREHADAMVTGWPDAPVLIELGSGSSTKTRRLIGAALSSYGELHYVPIDVSPTILEASARELVHDFLPLRVTGYAGDYLVALEEIARRIRKPKCIVFLGSSLGNYADAQALALLSHVAALMGPSDRLLLGTDLAKDRATLEAAYDDAQGVTAAFNRNLLVRINRELGGDFDPGSFAHEARYRDDLARVEMHLVSLHAQTVRIPAADLDVVFAAGESIHTENSHKYSLASLASLADRAGFAEEVAWTDTEGRFRVQRWRTRPG